MNIHLEDLQPNTPLMTKNSQRFTNARVLKIESEVPSRILVLTDFGNVITLTLAGINRYYELSTVHQEMLSYTKDKEVPYLQETIRENILMRITLLEIALNKLN